MKKLKQLKLPIPKQYEEMTLCEQVVFLHNQGYTNNEMIAAGHNKNTVKRQVSDYKKLALLQNEIV